MGTIDSKGPRFRTSELSLDDTAVELVAFRRRKRASGGRADGVMTWSQGSGKRLER